MGFDKPQRTVAQGYGATMALPVWVEVMNAASEPRYPAMAMRAPADAPVAQWPPQAGELPQTGSPPQVVPVVPAGGGSPPKAELVNPPRVEPVLKPFRP